MGGSGGIGGSGGGVGGVGGSCPVIVLYASSALVTLAVRFGTRGPSKHAKNTKVAAVISVISANSGREIPDP